MQHSVWNWDTATTSVMDEASDIVSSDILVGDSLEVSLQHDPYSQGPLTDLETERLKADNRRTSALKATVRAASARIIAIVMLLVIIIGSTNPESIQITENIRHIFSNADSEFHKVRLKESAHLNLA